MTNKSSNYRLNKKQTPKKKAISKKWFYMVFVLVLGTVLSEATNHSYLLHKRKAISSTISVKPVELKQSSKDNDTTSPVTGETSKSSNTSPTSSSTNSSATAIQTSTLILIEPWGSFVSNGTPGAGNGAPVTETSVCNTTPGATCLIQFKNVDGVIKSLEAGTADINGSVIWPLWDIKAEGFTDGAWTITATATLNGQSKTSTYDRILAVKL